MHYIPNFLTDLSASNFGNASKICGHECVFLCCLYLSVAPSVAIWFVISVVDMKLKWITPFNC